MFYEFFFEALAYYYDLEAEVIMLATFGCGSSNCPKENVLADQYLASTSSIGQILDSFYFLMDLVYFYITYDQETRVTRLVDFKALKLFFYTFDGFTSHFQSANGFVRLTKVHLVPSPLARNATLEAIRLQTHAWRNQCQALFHPFFLPFLCSAMAKERHTTSFNLFEQSLVPTPDRCNDASKRRRCGAGRARFILTPGRVHAQISRIAAFDSRSRATRQPCRTSTAVGTPVHCFDALPWRLLPGRNCPRPRSKPPPPPPAPLSIDLCFFDDNTLSSFSSDSRVSARSQGTEPLPAREYHEYAKRIFVAYEDFTCLLSNEYSFCIFVVFPTARPPKIMGAEYPFLILYGSTGETKGAVHTGDASSAPHSLPRASYVLDVYPGDVHDGYWVGQGLGSVRAGPQYVCCRSVLTTALEPGQDPSTCWACALTGASGMTRSTELSSGSSGVSEYTYEHVVHSQ
ncbi:hypothetical protein K438DRAFT_1755261 [Mycena galopus ATCC 62051]|nr:hypothetical protein K438DRAFT_1755261 [Mycena galopus ATCC 62051]